MTHNEKRYAVLGVLNSAICPNVTGKIRYKYGNFIKITHPIHPLARNARYEYEMEITIGDNVVIGAGSVVT